MCTGKRQTHIRNAPSSRTAVTGIGPHSWAGGARGLPRQCENQIMLGCQQSGVSRPIMVTMVGATLARP